MGLDVYFGRIVQPNNEFVLDTLEYDELEICMNSSNSKQCSRLVTNIHKTAINSNQDYRFANQYCEADELSMDKKGRYTVPYLQKKIKFEDLVEYQKVFYEFSIEETEYNLSQFFITIKTRLDCPFVYTREQALVLIPYLKEEFMYLESFLTNFETGVHIIYYNY